jgi:CPA2 family monovalent cation:H+ antiporter-2
MFAIPALAALGRRAARRIEAKVGAERHGVEHIHDGEAMQDHVVIGGYGRVGATIGRILDAEEIPFVALDNDADLVAEMRKAGTTVFFGDASRREILDKVGGAGARAFVVTTDAPEAAERMVKAIKESWPQAVILARALDADHALRLKQAGVTDVVPEALEGSLQLAGLVLSQLGMPDESVDARLDAARVNEVRRLGN